jgi:hypothetical protein
MRAGVPRVGNQGRGRTKIHGKRRRTIRHASIRARVHGVFALRSVMARFLPVHVPFPAVVSVAETAKRFHGKILEQDVNHCNRTTITKNCAGPRVFPLRRAGPRRKPNDGPCRHVVMARAVCR